MSKTSLQGQIRSLEAQLDVLKARIATATEKEKTPKRFADLFGVLEGKSDTTEKELREAEYRFDWRNEKKD